MLCSACASMCTSDPVCGAVPDAGPTTGAPAAVGARPSASPSPSCSTCRRTTHRVSRLANVSSNKYRLLLCRHRRTLEYTEKATWKIYIYRDIYIYLSIYVYGSTGVCVWLDGVVQLPHLLRDRQLIGCLCAHTLGCPRHGRITTDDCCLCTIGPAALSALALHDRMNMVHVLMTVVSGRLTTLLLPVPCNIRPSVWR